MHNREIEWSSRTSAELNSSCPGRFHFRKDRVQQKHVSKRITFQPQEAHKATAIIAFISKPLFANDTRWRNPGPAGLGEAGGFRCS
jgi:hypothetical protein